jgi:uncharacterized alkaline shock family protein YloU
MTMALAPTAPVPVTVPADRRGSTRIADRVLVGIAAQAAHEVLRAVPGGLARPLASVDVGSGGARVRLAIELPYPADIARTAGTVRQHVAARVEELSGRQVIEVVVVVERLRATAASDEDRRIR